MKRQHGLLILAVIAFASCNNSTGNKVENAADTAMAKVDTAVSNVKNDIKNNRDADFVSNVIKGNTQELHLLDLAVQKATRKDIKDAAKHMKPDHEKMGEEMTAYATKNNISVAVDSSDMTSSMDNDAAGKDWDKNWVDKLVDAHKSLIDKFESEEKDANDPELKTMVTNALPTLRKHYDMVKGIQDKMK